MKVLVNLIMMVALVSTSAFSKEIKVKFQNIKGKYKHWRLEGLLARVVQHEIDHLDGILFVDYLEEKDEHSIKNAPD